MFKSNTLVHGIKNITKNRKVLGLGVKLKLIEWNFFILIIFILNQPFYYFIFYFFKLN